MDALTPEQRELAESWWDDAQAIARRQAPKYLHFVDVEDAAADGLFRAVRVWIAGRPYLPLLNHCVRLAWADLLRYERGRSGRKILPKSFSCLHRKDVEAFLPHVAGFELRTGIVGAGIVSDEDPVGAELEAHDEVDRFTRYLTPQQAKVVRRRFLYADTVTLKSTGRHFGVTEARAHQILHGAYETLRREIA